MTLQLHDTLRRKKVEFEPLNPGKVTMYLCGPTVYNYAHIGNARPAVVFDVLARLLRRSYDLTFARNITDVDDKIISKANDEGVDFTVVAQRNIDEYFRFAGDLNILPADIYPRATEHIDDIIADFEQALEKA